MEVTTERMRKSKNEKTSASTRRASLKLALDSLTRKHFSTLRRPLIRLRVRRPEETTGFLVTQEQGEETWKDASEFIHREKLRSRQPTRAPAPALTRNYRSRQERDKRKTCRVSVLGKCIKLPLPSYLSSQTSHRLWTFPPDCSLLGQQSKHQRAEYDSFQHHAVSQNQYVSEDIEFGA
jgi:hypothetical protein